MGWEDRADALANEKLTKTDSIPNWERRVASGIDSLGPGSKDENPSSPITAPEPSSIPSAIVKGVKDTAGGFASTVRGIGKGLLGANDQVIDIAKHPIDTLGNPQFRTEAMRGVNDAVMPFVGNRIVSAIGGAPVESEDDTKAFPNARSLGNVAGMAVPVPFGEIAGLAKQGIKGAANKAIDREVERGAVAFGEGAGKRIKGKLQAKEGEPIRNVLREEPELLDAAHKPDAIKTQAAQTVLSKGQDDLKKIYREADIAHGRKPVATDIIEAAQSLEDRGAASRDAAKVFPEGTPQRLAADKEASTFESQSQQLRRDAAKKISDSRVRGIRSHDPLQAWDSRISDLKNSSIESERKAGKVLEDLKDGYKSKFSDPNEIVPTTTLRAVQSDYQLTGYGRPQPGDVQASANLLAHQEASKIVGNSVIEHVTGMNYRDAVALAEKDPNSIAGKLLSANEKVSVANNVLAGIEARKGASHGGSKIEKAINALHATSAVLSHGASIPVSVAVKAAPHAPRAIDRATIALSKMNGPSNEAAQAGARAIQASNVDQ